MRWFCLFAATAAAALAQTSAPNATGVSMGHVHLIVADPEEHKKLWVGLLGGQASSLPPLELVRFPGIFVILQKARTPLADGSDGSTVNHFGFLVKSYADIRAKLTAANLTFTMDNANTKQVIAVFPDKVRVEFTEDANLKTPIAFHHIHVATTDQEATRGWYVKTFGGDAGKRGAFPSAMFPGGEVDFLKANDAAAATKGRSLDHIGFEVKGLEAFCKKLEADGMKFDMTYREIPQLGGLKIAFVIDPIGTRIELTEGLASR
ncbi:MAG TPA: VOC family protein [Bryobacteraceae bacterium]|nr:VOC family protein [Bryobacteraceae bacterium]